MTAFGDLALDPAVGRWIARIDALAADLPGLASDDPQLQRKAARHLSDLIAIEFTQPVVDDVDIENFVLETPSGGLRARRYRRRDAPALAPTQLWLHGGGFYGGAFDEDLGDRLCSALALSSGVQILSLDYRLAPEHCYPAPADDAAAALVALELRAEEFGIDMDRLGLGGNSAGAAIAASAALRLVAAGTSRLFHLDLEVPVAAMRPIGSSAIEYARGFGLDDVSALVDLYLGPDGAADAFASAVDAPGFADLPPTRIAVAEYDPLRDSGVLLAENLKAAGVPVVFSIGKGHLHSSLGLTAQMDAARTWQTHHAAELAAAYHTVHTTVIR